ncbi:unnamed protein product [Rhizophagus irregularis]|uniref:Uncharacterized protein n=1 Tax=Rhizophagus irregularis TaxID=588596 RepID=A0A2N1P0H6_9GLOM|nr:hypothetical protein RhiirC2_768881 [Rhizophagus irregularis]CAB4383529.1 unnamed protein product [Rhizophagus irregularis]CAB5389050.1 unnamed protein product [Rhizophagus irregularis]
MKGKKPIFIDLVNEDDEGNDDTIQQNKKNNDQSTQQNERNNDSNESALQMQVEELTRLLKSVMKEKQKVTDPKENIIDWSNVDLEIQGPKSRKNQYVTRSLNKPKYVQKYGISGLSKIVQSRLSPSPFPSSSSSSSSTSSSPSSKLVPSSNSAPSSNSSSFLHYEKMNRD